MLLIITSTGDRLFRFINIDDLERPRTPPKKGFLVNFLQFLDAALISTPNCDEMVGDRPRQRTYKIFSIELRFSSPSPDPLSSRRPAHSGVRQLPPSKKWLFYCNYLM